MLRKVAYCSGGLYAVQVGYMDVQEGYMLKKTMMFIVATNVIASRLAEPRPTGMPIARANYPDKGEIHVSSHTKGWPKYSIN